MQCVYKCARRYCYVITELAGSFVATFLTALVGLTVLNTSKRFGTRAHSLAKLLHLCIGDGYAPDSSPWAALFVGTAFVLGVSVGLDPRMLARAGILQAVPCLNTGICRVCVYPCLCLCLWVRVFSYVCTSAC